MGLAPLKMKDCCFRGSCCVRTLGEGERGTSRAIWEVTGAGINQMENGEFLLECYWNWRDWEQRSSGPASGVRGSCGRRAGRGEGRPLRFGDGFLGKQ